VVFGVAVPVAAKGTAEVESIESVEKGAGIQRAAEDTVAQGEMGADDGGFCAVEGGKGGIEPGEGRGLNEGEEDFAVVGGIEADELPAGVLEVVVDGAGEDLVEGGVAVIRGVVVIANGGVEGDSEGTEDVLYSGELPGETVIGEIAVDEDKVRVMGADIGDDLAEPRVAALVAAVDVVNDDKTEGRGRLGGGEG